MKKFTSLLIGCFLALAGVAMAQQTDDQQTGKKKHEEKSEATGANAHAGAKAEKKTSEMGEKRPGVKKNERVGEKAQKNEGTPAATTTTTNASGQSASTSTTPPETQPANEAERKGKRNRGEKANVSRKENATAAEANVKASATPVTSGSTGAAAATDANQPNNRRGNNKGEGKKVDAQQVQQIKTQHTSFHAQPKPDKAPAVTFNANYRIQGADRWQGAKYEAFRTYHPERHDQGWYRSHYRRVELIGGGYYYWNNGYWYPAWGYDPSAEYYAYDGPIYVGQRAEPPDQVIADVQSELQEMGYYQGEVDGLLGPLTRQALTAYQNDQGLDETAAIDEPTLDSLQLGS